MKKYEYLQVLSEFATDDLFRDKFWIIPDFFYKFWFFMFMTFVYISMMRHFYYHSLHIADCYTNLVCYIYNVSVAV